MVTLTEVRHYFMRDIAAGVLMLAPDMQVLPGTIISFQNGIIIGEILCSARRRRENLEIASKVMLSS